MPPQNPEPQAPVKRQPLLLYIGVLCLLILIAVSALWLKHKKDTSSSHNVSGSQQSTKYSYKYNKLETYQLKDESNKALVTFSKPQELKEPYSTPAPRQAEFTHSSGPNNQLPILAMVAVAAPSDSLAKDYPKDLGPNPGILKNLKDFINARKSPHYNEAVVEKLAPLTTANIKSGAWKANFSVSGQAPTKEDIAALKDKTITAPPNLKGEVIVVVSDSKLYYFLVESVEDNWSSNQTIWDQVIDSLKLGQ